MPTTRTICSHASMLPEIKTRLFPLSNEINAITRLFENDSRCSPNFRDRAKVKGGQINKTKHESGGVKTVFHETGSNNFETFFPFPPPPPSRARSESWPLRGRPKDRGKNNIYRPYSPLPLFSFDHSRPSGRDTRATDSTHGPPWLINDRPLHKTTIRVSLSLPSSPWPYPPLRLASTDSLDSASPYFPCMYQPPPPSLLDAFFVDRRGPQRLLCRIWRRRLH